MPFKLEGLLAATFTPMTENRDINLKVIDSYQQHLLDQGIQQIYVNGSTGEGPCLTTQERKELVEEWIRVSRLPNRYMKIVVQVGGTTDKETRELTEHAVLHKADAISSLPSLYFTPMCVDDLVEQCKRVSEMAKGVPFYYYHIPDRTGVKLNMQEFLVKCRTAVPDLRGIKFTSKDLFEGGKILRTKDANGDVYDILYGCDEQVLGAFAVGFTAAVGSTYNIAGRNTLNMKKFLEEGKLAEARRNQYRSVDFVKILFDYGTRCGGLLPAMKAVLNEIGINAGPTRQPMTQLSQAERASLMADLKNIGFFDWRKEC